MKVNLNKDKFDLEPMTNTLLNSIENHALPNEINNFISLMEDQYATCDSNSEIFSFIGEVEKDKENDLSKKLFFTNYNSNSLDGEMLALFIHPVFVSKIKTTPTQGNKNLQDTIRLISFAGTDKKFSSNPRTYNGHKFIPHSIFDVYDLVWGFILPKSVYFKSVSIINFKDLFENRESIESLSDGRDKLLNCAIDYKNTIQRNISVANTNINNLKTQHDEIKKSIAIQLEERNRLNESLEETKEIKERLDNELDTVSHKLNSNEKQLKDAKISLSSIVNEINERQIDVDTKSNELEKILNKIDLEQTNLERRQAQVRKSQSEIDTYSLDMNGFSKASRIHMWFCYGVMAALLSTLSNIFFMIYSNSSGLIDIINNHENTIPPLDILLSRLPAVTATTLTIATLSTLLFFLIKHIIDLHSDKMNMLKASILTEQVTYSLDCSKMSDSEIKELKRKSKIELLIKIFGFNGNKNQNYKIENHYIENDFASKLIEAIKSKAQS